MTSIRNIWSVASLVEKFILVTVPFGAVWDVTHGNLLDLTVGVVVFCWIILDIRKDLRLSDREQDNG